MDRQKDVEVEPKDGIMMVDRSLKMEPTNLMWCLVTHASPKVLQASYLSFSNYIRVYLLNRALGYKSWLKPIVALLFLSTMYVPTILLVCVSHYVLSYA
jgi:hypothetical protein